MKHDEKRCISTSDSERWKNMKSLNLNNYEFTMKWDEQKLLKSIMSFTVILKMSWNCPQNKGDTVDGNKKKVTKITMIRFIEFPLYIWFEHEIMISRLSWWTILVQNITTIYWSFDGLIVKGVEKFDDDQRIVLEVEFFKVLSLNNLITYLWISFNLTILISNP